MEYSKLNIELNRGERRLGLRRLEQNVEYLKLNIELNRGERRLGLGSVEYLELAGQKLCTGQCMLVSISCAVGSGS